MHICQANILYGQIKEVFITLETGQKEMLENDGNKWML